MTITDYLMILAIILGPIIAVQLQKRIEAWRSGRDRKIHIFKVLMSTRGTPMSPGHVEALNLIDVEFSGKKEKDVREAWGSYLDHLGNGPKDYQDPSHSVKLDAWSKKSNECLVDLLFAMSKILGYTFDKVRLKNGAYTPQGFADLNWEQSLLRKGVLDVLYGKSAIPIKPINPKTQTD